MKIAIQGHPTRGKEVIQILKSLGGVKAFPLSGDATSLYYYIDYDCHNTIRCHDVVYVNKYCKKYTLEEFEKEFPFKIGDMVLLNGFSKPYKVIALEWYMNKLCYKLDNRLHYTPETLKPYKEMEEERNITLTLDKAKEWYKKGGELKEIALQAFTEKELNPLPKSWEEFCKQGNPVVSWLYNVPLKYEALFKLEQLRDCWRQGNIPKRSKYKIRKIYDTYEVIYGSEDAFLSFYDLQTAEEFLKCFRDLIEKAGDLI